MAGPTVHGGPAGANAEISARRLASSASEGPGRGRGSRSRAAASSAGAGPHLATTRPRTSSMSGRISPRIESSAVARTSPGMSRTASSCSRVSGDRNALHEQQCLSLPGRLLRAPPSQDESLSVESSCSDTTRTGRRPGASGPLGSAPSPCAPQEQEGEAAARGWRSAARPDLPPQARGGPPRRAPGPTAPPGRRPPRRWPASPPRSAPPPARTRRHLPQPLPPPAPPGCSA